MAYSRECANCEARWPQGYVRCPACESMTTMVRREPNRSQFQAREADFERRYVEREAQRIAQGHIAPEGLGRREARVGRDSVDASIVTALGEPRLDR